MERLKIFKEFDLSEDELEKVVGGVEMSTMAYGLCIFACETCTTCTTGCSTCTNCAGCTDCAGCSICSSCTILAIE